MPNLQDQVDFLSRNTAAIHPEGGLEVVLQRAASESRPLRVKLGMDPTAPDIHLGHVVVLQKLREFQDLGHKVVLIIGDYTARVGDPSGRSATRPVLTVEQINSSAETYRQQVTRVLRDEPDLLEVRRNGEWLEMGLDRFLALSRIPKVAQLLERDDFSKRYKAGKPISLLEFIYPLLQGYDSVAIDADIELGGTDQTFNLLFGRDVQKAEGREAQQVVITLPLLTGLDGVKKMSKSLDNHIGVSESPSEIYGRTLKISDQQISEWADLLGVALEADPGEAPRDAKRSLARALCNRFAGEGTGEAAEAEFDKVFGRKELPTDIPEFSLLEIDGTQDVHLPALLSQAFGISRSEARRSIQQGALKIDEEAHGGQALDVPRSELTDKVLQLGKRRFIRLID